MKLDRTRLGAAVALVAIAGAAAWVTLGVGAVVRGLPAADLVIFCAWALRAAAGWLLLGVGVSCLSAARLPVMSGSFDLIAELVCPVGIRRLADLAIRGGITVGVSAGLVAGGLAATASAAVPSSSIPHHPPTHLATLSLDWPGTHSAHVRPPEVAPPLGLPADSTEPAIPVVVATTPSSVARLHHHRAKHRAPVAMTTEHVIVGPGDSLWSIAAAHLPPDANPAEVARAWHAWWQTNRAVIGADPSMIRPGERLVAPASLTGDRS